ncbi:hypothetical protein GCM10012320_24340 [Sinomonas cellulolyticus]|uniref:ABC transporter n=1 Tax=Sinomonas cellulolyticus TaxID=2801916 RepID=A0ABS1K0T0_9MICC|nr:MULTISPECIES: hypothetical protein [Sinomonas]MBL0704987.1 hypothetical protein [Sinomonas cellulolyticus]GHG53615.1 hypothetical protein GCM10012320_24340 [Sinomonas sp. KCTC 49339]
MATADAPTNRVRHYLGAWSAVSVVQFFVAEAATIAAWRGPAPYSRRLNLISDLGQRHCGLHGTREVCSPLHALMNVSFVLQGFGMVIAALLITSTVLRVAADVSAIRAETRLTRAVLAQARTTPRGGARTRVAAALASGHPAVAVPWAAALAVRVLVGLAGVGVAVVGFAPQDTNEVLHLAGAGTYFVCGSAALVVLGILWIAQTAAAWPILLLGGASFVATLTGGALFLRVPEPGTFERFMAYPITVGIAVAGGVIAYRLGVPAARQVLRRRLRSG